MAHSELGGDLGHRALAEQPLTRGGQRLLVHVRWQGSATPAGDLTASGEHDRQGGRLLAACAPGRPYPQGALLGARRCEARKDRAGEGRELLRVAEEERFLDGDVRKQGAPLPGMPPSASARTYSGTPAKPEARGPLPGCLREEREVSRLDHVAADPLDEGGQLGHGVGRAIHGRTQLRPASLAS